MMIPAAVMKEIKAVGWGDAVATALPADFSTRRFWRLTRGTSTAILMLASPDQKTAEFIAVAAWLRQAGIKAPEIYAADAALGFVLMEDFGADNLGRLLDAGQADLQVYRQAVDLLLTVHHAKIPQPAALPYYAPELFATQAAWFLDYYWPYHHGITADAATRQGFHQLWLDLLQPLTALPHSLLLRDFMPDNLMRLSDGSLGVLDFQDAGWGPVAYDIASLCECVRRDVPLATLDAMIDDYLLQRSDISREALRSACYLLAAQRHLRILGNLARFAKDPQHATRLTYMPRVWNYLRQILAKPELQALRDWLRAAGFDIYLMPSLTKLSDTAMVLAAGMGTRMRPLTLTKPKPLQEIGGRTMLDLALDRLVAAGIRRAVVNVHYLADQIEQHLQQRQDIEIIISREPTLLDTGGGIKKVLPEFGGKPFLVLSADLPLMDGAAPTLERMAAAWNPDVMDVLLLVAPTAQSLGFEDSKGDYFMDTAGRLTRLQTVPPRPYVMLSTQIMKPELFTGIETDIFSNIEIWSAVEKNQRLYGLVHDGSSYHVGTPEDLAKANQLLATGQGWCVET